MGKQERGKELISLQGLGGGKAPLFLFPLMRPMTKEQLLNQINTMKMEVIMLPQDNCCSMFRKALFPYYIYLHQVPLYMKKTLPVTVQSKAQIKECTTTVYKSSNLGGLSASSLDISPGVFTRQKTGLPQSTKKVETTCSLCNFIMFFQKGPKLKKKKCSTLLFVVPLLVWASLIAQLVKNLPAMQDTRFDSWVRKIHWRRDRLPTPVFLGFPGGSAGKESTCNAGHLGLIYGLGRSPGEWKGYPLQHSGLENSRDYIVHGVAKRWIQLSDFHFLFTFSQSTINS